jgi:hypothetical protein
MSESFTVQLGSHLPLSLTLPDGASGLFPQAFVYDSADVAVAGSPFDLAEVGTTGRYTNAAFTPIAAGNYTAHFIVFSDAGHLTEATTYERDQDSFVVELQAATPGAAVNTPANANSTITTGATVSGDFSETSALDGTYWQIEDTAGTLDMYFEFLVSGDGVPISASMHGRVQGANDSLDVFAWNWLGTTWEQIGVLTGQGSPTDALHTYTLFAQHVGTGADLGKVRIRFFNTGLTGADLYVDQVFVSYAVVNRSVGYALGAIWIDTTGGGTAGTTPFLNGTADNPVDGIADAITLSGSTNLRLFALSPGSSIVLPQTFDGYVFFGDRWTVDLNGQAIPNTVIRGAAVSGVCTGASPRFSKCQMSVVTVPPCSFDACGLEGARITLGSAGDYFWDQCFSGVAGTGTYIVDFGVAVGTTNLNMRHYSGGAEFENMGQVGTDLVSLEGHGQFILNANCVGGTVACRGNFDRTDNSGGGGGGAVTFSDTARFALPHLTSYLETDGPNPHGTGAWTGTTPTAVATAVWSELLPGAFTAGMAGYLIGTYLDAAVSAVPTNVWATVISGNNDNTQAGGCLNLAYQAAWNRQELDPANDKLELWDRAGTTVIGYWPMKDASGLTLVALPGGPARRGVFV